MAISTLRIRLNKSRRLHPVLCTRSKPFNFEIDGQVFVGSTQWKETWGMRSATDQATNYEVKVATYRSISLTTNKERISHAVYVCNCQCVSSPDMHVCKGSECAVCYHSLATIRAMAAGKGKKVVFCRDMKNALLKRKIYKGSLIEVKSGANSVYGVAY